MKDSVATLFYDSWSNANFQICSKMWSYWNIRTLNTQVIVQLIAQLLPAALINLLALCEQAIKHICCRVHIIFWAEALELVTATRLLFSALVHRHCTAWPVALCSVCVEIKHSGFNQNSRTHMLRRLRVIIRIAVITGGTPFSYGGKCLNPRVKFCSVHLRVLIL